MLKKLFKSKSNVLIIYSVGHALPTKLVNNLRQAAAEIRGEGVIVYVPCSSKEMKSVCKKVFPNIWGDSAASETPASTSTAQASAATSPGAPGGSTGEAATASSIEYIIKHYLHGEFHKDFDRLETARSFVTFLRDPTGDLTWEDETTSRGVFTLRSSNALAELLRTRNYVFIMFHGEACVGCGSVRRELGLAATALNKVVTMATLDIGQPSNAAVLEVLAIKDLTRPTLLLFE